MRKIEFFIWLMLIEVYGVNCFSVNGRSSSCITGCRLEKWENPMEYMVRVTGNF